MTIVAFASVSGLPKARCGPFMRELGGGSSYESCDSFDDEAYRQILYHGSWYLKQLRGVLLLRDSQ